MKCHEEEFLELSPLTLQHPAESSADTRRDCRKAPEDTMMSSLSSDSSGGNGSTSQHQSQVPNLNPSARSFTPTGSAPSSATLTGLGDLAYHQSKAVEAANMVAQVLPHLDYSVDHKRASELGNQKNHTKHSQTEHTTSKPSCTPPSVHSTGLSAGSNAPTTPPNRHARVRRTSSTPAAYTFKDDDEFYPGTDPQLKKNARYVKC